MIDRAEKGRVMWEDIDLVPDRTRDPREPRAHPIRELVLLVIAAIIASLIPLLT
jgi:hypothetical protein